MSQQPTTRPRIVYLATGGTIASVRGQGAAGATPTLTAAQIAADVPGLAEAADLEARQLVQKPSVDLGFADVTAVLAAAREAVDGGAAGVVVSQGTDTIEETAYALDLCWDRTEPLVVTGAMRNPSLAGGDGPANLLAAVQTAAATTSRDRGVLVVLNEEIHAARLVQKRHTFAASAFASPAGGPLGRLAEGEPRYLGRLPQLPVVAYAGEPVPPVALVTVALDDDLRLLPALADLGYRGCVLAGAGGGHVPARTVAAVRDLVTRMPVVLTSRIGAGEVLTRTYAYAGSEQELIAAGALPAGGLHPLKARVLLATLLATGADPDRVAAELRLRG